MSPLIKLRYKIVAKRVQMSLEMITETKLNSISIFIVF